MVSCSGEFTKVICPHIVDAVAGVGAYEIECSSGFRIDAIMLSIMVEGLVVFSCGKGRERIMTIYCLDVQVIRGYGTALILASDLNRCGCLRL